MFDIAAAIVLAKTAVNAYGELKELLDDAKGVLSAEDEAQLKPYLQQLEKRNTELFATVDEKLTRAALDTDGEGFGPDGVPPVTR